MADCLHLASGDSAAGTLREATAQGVLLLDEVIRFRDVLALGPLGALGTPHGPSSRAAYWDELRPEAPPPVVELQGDAGDPARSWVRAFRD